MYTGKAKQHTLFEEEEEFPSILTNPLIKKIIKTFAPEMVHHPDKHQETLLSIHSYLLDQSNLESIPLRRLLPEEFYETLYQLKKELRETDLRRFSLALEIHKEQFKSFIQQEALEEE